MLFQLASVPLSPRRVLCRSGECRQRISYTKQRWAQLLFFGNVLLVCFDRTSGRTVLQMKHLIERKREEFIKKSFMIPIIRINKKTPEGVYAGCVGIERITGMLDGNGKLSSVCNKCVQERRRCSVKD